MDIKIDERAYNFIVNNGETIKIYTNSIRGCCGGQTTVAMEPQIELGTPTSNDIDNYKRINHRQITIYINKNLDEEMLTGKKIIIKRALGIFKRLILSNE